MAGSSARPFLVAEDIEEDATDLVFGALVPGGGQAPISFLDGRGGLALVPRLEHGEKDVVPVPGHVTPAGGPLLVHGHGVAVDPEEVQGEVAQYLEARLVGRRLHGLKD